MSQNGSFVALKMGYLLKICVLLCPVGRYFICSESLICFHFTYEQCLAIVLSLLSLSWHCFVGFHGPLVIVLTLTGEYSDTQVIVLTLLGSCLDTMWWLSFLMEVIVLTLLSNCRDTPWWLFWYCVGNVLTLPGKCRDMVASVLTLPSDCLDPRGV